MYEVFSHIITNAMIVGTKNRISNLGNPEKMKYMECDIKFVRQCTYLGIVLDNIMSLVPLVNNVKKRVSNRIFMLKKLRKCITVDAAVLIYKQMILPLIDYAGFLLISCRICDKSDIQVLQNDILRICDKSRVADRVSIEKLHNKYKVLSLEQRMHKQLLWLMYLLSKEGKFVKAPARVTKNADKIVFKVPTRITPKYEKSPFYMGTILWNELSRDIQIAQSVPEFKKAIDKRYKKYRDLL